MRTATATRFLRGLAEHSPANVTNYTRCVFQMVEGAACHEVDQHEQHVFGATYQSRDEAFALCDADPKCDAVQKRDARHHDRKNTVYQRCSLGKDACGRARLGKNTRSGCGGHGDDEPGADCSVHHVFTCLPYDEAPAMRSEGLFALCIIMIFACPLLICIGTAAAAAAWKEEEERSMPWEKVPPVFMIYPMFCCPLVVLWIFIFAYLSAYYGPAHNHSSHGACDPRVEPWGTAGAAIVVCGAITTGILLCAACSGRATTRQRDPEMDLWEACSQGDVAAVRRVLKKGAAVNRANEYGETPLLIACSNGRVAAAQLLLDNGAEVDRAVSYTHLTLPTKA